MERERALVIGGTKGTGLLITHLLMKSGYHVRVLARDPSRAAALLGAEGELIAGDITKPETLDAALSGADHIVFTAGVPSGRYALESQVKQTDYQGVLNTLAAARRTRFSGRFLYLNSIGVTRASLSATLLNLLKRNTLVWRRRVEDAIRADGLDYTIIRVGFLLNRPGGQRAVKVTQEALPLSPRHRIARADAAAVFVAALRDVRTSRTTFDIVWDKGGQQEKRPDLFGQLYADA